MFIIPNKSIGAFTKKEKEMKKSILSYLFKALHVLPQLLGKERKRGSEIIGHQGIGWKGPVVS
jgi:hypothetical protein